MTLSDENFKAIFARRDARYDGRFYVGVKTTGIYCRPICPAKPKPENIVIFKSLSEAEKAGYRPCLRCHPDSAPGNRLWDGTVSTVARAIRLLDDATDEELTVESLASIVGISARHLRRLFDEHLGASPVEILITRRLHFAKQAIRETKTPITDIAFASGFQSVRRFNEAFVQRFRQAPSTFREAHAGARSDGPLALRIPVRLPYDWPTVIAYLKRHEAYGIEFVEENAYRRFIPRNKGFGSVRVSRHGEDAFLVADFIDIPLIDVRPVLRRLRDLFDADHNPVHLPNQPSILGGGIRVPGSFDPFETAVSIILSQLVSTTHAKKNLKALIERFGRQIGREGNRDVFAFPTPNVMARAAVKKIGTTRVKAAAIRALARAVADGKLDFRLHRDFSEVRNKLLEIKGIGPWTAMMIGMRCMGDPDAFPENDLIIQRAIEKMKIDSADWISSRAYLTHCLWRDFGATLSKTKKRGGTSDEVSGDR